MLRWSKWILICSVCIFQTEGMSIFVFWGKWTQRGFLVSIPPSNWKFWVLMKFCDSYHKGGQNEVSFNSFALFEPKICQFLYFGANGPQMGPIVVISPHFPKIWQTVLIVLVFMENICFIRMCWKRPLIWNCFTNWFWNCSKKCKCFNIKIIVLYYSLTCW